MTKEDDQLAVQKDLGEIRMRFFERLRTICDANEEYRRAMGLRPGGFEEYVTRIVKDTEKKIETTIRAFEKKYPD